MQFVLVQLYSISKIFRSPTSISILFFHFCTAYETEMLQYFFKIETFDVYWYYRTNETSNLQWGAVSINNWFFWSSSIPLEKYSEALFLYQSFFLHSLWDWNASVFFKIETFVVNWYYLTNDTSSGHFSKRQKKVEVLQIQNPDFFLLGLKYNLRTFWVYTLFIEFLSC